MDQNENLSQVSQVTQVPMPPVQQAPIAPLPPEPIHKSNIWKVLLVVLIVVIAGILFWQFSIKKQSPVELINQSSGNVNNNMNQNTPDPAMKAAYDGYFNAIANNSYADFIKIIDPDQAAQVDESGFGFLVQRAKEGGMLSTLQSAKFTESMDVSSRYNIPTLSLYLAEYEHEMEDPLDGIGGPKRGNFTTGVNAMFLVQVNDEWKVKSYSSFNYRKTGDADKDKADFDAELERFLKGVAF